MNDHQKCVFGNGVPCRNMPPTMSGHFGLDLGVAVHHSYYCVYIYIYIYIQYSLLYKTTPAAKPKWSYTPGGLIRQVELVKQNLSYFNATVVSCFYDVDM